MDWGESSRDMVIDWLAAGVNPGNSTIFIQSRIPEHAELHTLLSMITPLGCLERVPSYKDQQEKIRVNFDGFAVRRNCLIYLTQVTKRIAKSSAGITMPGIEFNGFMVRGNRSIKPPLLTQYITKPMKGLRVFGIDFNLPI